VSSNRRAHWSFWAIVAVSAFLVWYSRYAQRQNKEF